MTSIDASHRLATLLRNQIPALRGGGVSDRHVKGAAQPKHHEPDAASIAARRIQALSPEDPDRKRKALRIFLESVLVQELGPELVHDPLFPEMLDAVQKQMLSDKQIAAAADELGELLVTGGASR